ncbi:polysaccharide deacetylase family protein, partial [Kitasatospora sp. NPDC036755]|uniref:polysaccharide deacetylase family protein n=1 Tax=Kitasatospora sp. NPDC036755 TaxID=3154600 RepID=UPI0033E8F775
MTRAEVVERYGPLAPSEWGLEVSGVTTELPEGEAATALTFDACGGPGGNGYDAGLIDFLRAHDVPATLFLNARWIDANPDEFERLAADPLFEIGNHGTVHRPLSVTGRSAYGIAGPYRRYTCLNPRAHEDGGCEHEDRIVPGHVRG